MLSVCAFSTEFSSNAVQITVCFLLFESIPTVNNRIEGGQNGYGEYGHTSEARNPDGRMGPSSRRRSAGRTRSRGFCAGEKAATLWRTCIWQNMRLPFTRILNSRFGHVWFVRTIILNFTIVVSKSQKTRESNFDGSDLGRKNE